MCRNSLQELVLEKETRVRELLLITGLKQWVLWTAWFLKQFLFLFIISLLITPILKVYVCSLVTTWSVMIQVLIDSTEEYSLRLILESYSCS